MRGLLILAAAAFAGLACGFSAQDADGRALGYTNNGRAAPWFYHHVEGDCANIVHGYGRNSAWGVWTLPLGDISSGVVMGGDGGYEVVFDCLDGSDCVDARDQALWDPTERVGHRHLIPFETLERAELFVREVAALREACALTSPPA